MIIFHNNSNNVNFKAKLIAQCDNLNLYKITDKSDIKAIENLCAITNFKKLMPNLLKEKSDRWHEMLEYAYDNAKNKDNITYIDSFNNKICGILTYTPGSTTYLDCICTIPNSPGEKVKLAGKALLLQLFKDFLSYRGSKIKLLAITDGPYDTIKKYKEFGFIETEFTSPSYTEMIANKHKIATALNYLKDIVNYKAVEPKHVNLFELI